MLVKRRHYRPIPQGAEIITNRKGQRFARWTNSRGTTHTRPLNKEGNRIVIESHRWYVRLKDSDGQWKERKAYTDKTASAVLENDLTVKIERGMVGLSDPMDDHRKRPLAEHLDAYERHLASKENTAAYVEQTMQRCRDIIEGIKAAVIGDITAGRVEGHLADLRRGGMSMASSNHYLRAIKSFYAWLVRDRRAPDNPLTGLAALALTEQDKKHRRRALTDTEVTALVNAATASDKSFRGIPGGDRAMLYIVAMNTGLRASELASLTHASFDLDGETPTVCCLGGYTKNGQEATLPLRADMVGMVKEWLAGKPVDAPLWPGSWARSRAAAGMIRMDLSTARKAWIEQALSEEEKAQREQSDFLAYRDSSDRIADFHALRHTFITNLARAKVHPKNAQALARHSTINLTMNVYTHTILGDLANDVDKLPALPTPAAGGMEAVALANTGTDGANPGSDDNPKRRTKRRALSDLSCEKLSSGGQIWRKDEEADGGAANAENRENTRELSRLDEQCLAVSNTNVQKPKWRNWQTRRIQNPVSLGT